MLASRGTPMSPLGIAVEAGDAVTVRHLLSLENPGPVISEMRMAAYRGYTNIVELFLDSGAIDIDARDTDGRTCLAFATKHPSLVKMLLERGAKTQIRALDGGTPLHCASRGQHTESAILLLKSGANIDLEDYENQTPLDIALLVRSPSAESISLVKALLEHGCYIGKPDSRKWRTVLMGADADVVVITETYNPAIFHNDRGSGSNAVAGKDRASPERPAKPRNEIEIVQQAPKLPHPIWSDEADVPAIRRLYSGPAAHLLLPKMDPQLMQSGSVVEWQWCKQDGDFTPSGRGISTVASLVTAIGIEAFLSCYVSFEYITRIPLTHAQGFHNGVSYTFQSRNERSQIFWTMRKLSTDPANRSNRAPTPVFRSEDFRGTLEIGWIPDSGIDFFTCFIVDLHKKWRVVFDDVDVHLRKNRKLLLDKEGSSRGFIYSLLYDAQQWSNFRATLEMQLCKARDLAQDFKKNRYLCEEVNMKEGGEKNRKKTPAAVAIEKLSKAIQRMEVEAKNEIRKLDERTKEMIELQFNLVGISEAYTATAIAHRAAFWAHIFLPWMFVSSLFGMNVDVLAGGPHWWWVIVLGVVGMTLITVFIIFMNITKFWILPKIEERTTNSDFSNGQGSSTYSQRKMIPNHAVDLESKLEPGEAPEYTSTGRQWTKLKDL